MIYVSKNHFENVQTFIFLFANTFIHEVGAHLVVTFLAQGRVNTPPSIRPNVTDYSNNNAIGESGRWFEEKFFQGTMEYFRDENQDNHQVCPSFQ